MPRRVPQGSLPQCEPHDSLTQLGKAYSHCSGSLWYQTELGHPGQRVCLETIELALGRKSEIYARVSPGAVPLSPAPLASPLSSLPPYGKASSKDPCPSPARSLAARSLCT